MHITDMINQTIGQGAVACLTVPGQVPMMLWYAIEEMKQAFVDANLYRQSTLTLLADIGSSAEPWQLAKGINISGSFTLDLNGHGIYFAIADQRSMSFLAVELLGSLSVRDGIGGGFISGDRMAVSLEGGRNLNITGGTFENTSDLPKSPSARILFSCETEIVEITGGVFKQGINILNPSIERCKIAQL